MSMRLVYKNIIFNTLVSLVILFAGEYCMYSFLRSRIDKEAVEHLTLERKILLYELRKGTDINNFTNNIGDEISVVPIEKSEIRDYKIEEVEMEEGEEDEEEKFVSKQIVFDLLHQNKAYRITILKSIDEDEGLGSNFLLILIGSGIGMLLILVTLNVIIFNRLFLPVNLLIKQIESFNIQGLKKIEPPVTNTLELIQLGEKISAMSKKNIDDYVAMKEFTENMTHELQTPLAVISTKIEQALQDKNLSEKQALMLSDAMVAVNKLLNLNRGLSLLSRLENHQYNSESSIKINQLIKERLNYFSDFIENKSLVVNTRLNSDIELKMDNSLAEVLIDNILKNAIKHNLQGGNLEVELNGNVLRVSNSGEPLTDDPQQFFKRFYTQKTYRSLGLGLSIVKKICEYYKFEVEYSYTDGMHAITIVFKSVKPTLS